jgi:hypothetical protein
MYVVQAFEEPINEPSVSISSRGALVSNDFLETRRSAIREDTISESMHPQVHSNLRKHFASSACRVQLRTMSTLHKADFIHDEYGPAEILEVVHVRPQCASVIFVKPTPRGDEATSCLALLGMRWLSRSEIMSESHRRNLCLDVLEAHDRQQPTHQAATYAT